MGRRKQQRKKSLSVTQPTLSDTRESIQRSSTDCDTSSGQPPVRSAVTRAQEAVLLRALLELVVVQLAVGVEENNMAPVPTPLPNNQQGTGLSKLMSPVQDLGRSLLSFLVGTSNPPTTTTTTTTSTFHPESEPPPLPPVKRASSKRDSLSSNTSKRNSLVPNSSAVASPGRQRPPGHPAHPTATSQTPAAVRRLGGAQKPQELPIPPYKEVPISPPPPSASSKDAIPSSVIKEEAAAEVFTSQPPTASRARRKKNKKTKKDTVEPQTSNSQVQQSELLQKAPNFPLQQVLCSEGEHQLCPPGAACGSSQISDADGGQGWVTARNSVCDPPGFSDSSQDTVRQEEEGHPAPEVAAGPPVAEELVAHRREHATRAATGVGSMHGSVSTGQLTGCDDTKQTPSEKEESEGGVSQPVLELISSPSTTASVPPAPAPPSPSSNGVPVPPPPPPEGFLLEGLKSPPVSRATEVAKGPSGTLKRNTRLTREEALLSQLSVLDDSFSSFLRTQLNITSAARDRDSVAELTDTATIRRKKERKRRNDSENSDCHGLGSSKAEVDQDNLVASEETHKESLSQEGQGLAGASRKVTTTEVRGRTSSNASEAASKGGRDRPISFADISESLEGGVKDHNTTSANVITECETQKAEVPEKPTKDNKVGGGSQVNKITETNIETDAKPGLVKAEAVFETAMAPVVAAHQEGLTGTSSKKAEKIAINKSNALYEGEINQANFSDATNKKVIAAPPQHAPVNHQKEEIEGRSAEKKPNKKETGMIKSSGKKAVKKPEVEIIQAKEIEVEKQEMKVETQPCVKQELSKSDSGYSGHISCGEEEPLPARRELNMEQAMRRFHKRLVPKEQAPAKTTTSRKRSDTEGTSATEDSDDSEDEEYRIVGRLGKIFI